MQVVQITKRVALPNPLFVTPEDLAAAKKEVADVAAAATTKAESAISAVQGNLVGDEQREAFRKQFDEMLSEEDGKIRKDISNLVDKDVAIDQKLAELKTSLDTKVETSDYNANATRIEYNFAQLMGAPVGE